MDIVSSLRQQDKASDSTRGENEFTAIRNVFNEMYACDTSKKIRATWQSKGKSGEHLATIKRSGLLMRKPQQLCSRFSRCVFPAWGRRKYAIG